MPGQAGRAQAREGPDAGLPASRDARHRGGRMRPAYRPGTRRWLPGSGRCPGPRRAYRRMQQQQACLLHRRQPAQDLCQQPRQCRRRHERTRLPADRAEQSPDQRKNVRQRREVRVPVSDHGTAELAVRPGHRDQICAGPASPDRGRGGRAIGHASEELGNQPAERRIRQMPVTNASEEHPAEPRDRHGHGRAIPGIKLALGDAMPLAVVPGRSDIR